MVVDLWLTFATANYSDHISPKDLTAHIVKLPRTDRIQVLRIIDGWNTSLERLLDEV
jgi:hypothetical protein